MQGRIVKNIINTRIYDLVRETPLSPAPLLSAALGNRVFLKREDLQEIFSFKIRGAYHKMTQMTAARLACGVVAASAGNHAQGVALAAKRLGCRAVVVMPRYTQKIKIDSVRARGAKVILHGDDVNESFIYAKNLAREEGATFIHPFDDADVIAGQGTVAAEILRAHPAPLHAIFAAVGGGGLIAGIAAYAKALRPQIKIIGVEPTDAACMRAALDAGRLVTLKQVGIFADAVAVKRAGKIPFQLCRELLDDVIVVDNDAICAAIKDIYDETRVVVEPAGALGVAGAKAYCAKTNARGKTLAAVSCGANMNFDRLRFVAERAELGERREALIAATIPEKPGSFRRFCALLGKRSITEFNYRISDPKIAHVFVGIEIAKASEAADIIRALNKEGCTAMDLSGDELAKLHIRHMVGGHSAHATNERLYRFEFPERPGALANFLSKMGQGWNISLFHYRNHGADYGRVLTGVQVPSGELGEFQKFLDDLGYPYHREAENPAYKMFLGGGK